MLFQGPNEGVLLLYQVLRFPSLGKSAVIVLTEDYSSRSATVRGMLDIQ